MLTKVLTSLAEDGLFHKNLSLTNILVDEDEKRLWIIDLEQTSDDLDELDIQGEVSNILYFYDQQKMRKGFH
jgi:RIO-like serine/threonine protein kinase